MPLILDILFHWNFVSATNKEKKPKLSSYPVNLSLIVDNAVHDHVEDINTEKSLSKLHKILDHIVDGDTEIDGFDRESFSYSLVTKKFISGMYLYGILPPNDDDGKLIVKVGSSKESAINKALCAIKEEEHWDGAIIATEDTEYEAVVPTGRTS